MNDCITVNDCIIMTKARLWWTYHKKVLALGGVSLALTLTFYAINTPFGQTKALEQALADKDGNALLSRLYDGLDPNTDVCADYQIANWAGI